MSLLVHIFLHKYNQPYSSALEELRLNDMKNIQQIWPRKKHKKETYFNYIFLLMQ